MKNKFSVVLFFIIFNLIFSSVASAMILGTDSTAKPELNDSGSIASEPRRYNSTNESNIGNISVRKLSFDGQIVPPSKFRENMQGHFANDTVIFGIFRVEQSSKTSIYNLNVTSGRLRWSENITSFVRILGVADGTLFLEKSDSPEEIIALDLKTGKRLWKLSPDARLLSINTQYVHATTGGKLVTLNRRSGEMYDSVPAADVSTKIADFDTIQYGMNRDPITVRHEETRSVYFGDKGIVEIRDGQVNRKSLPTTASRIRKVENPFAISDHVVYYDDRKVYKINTSSWRVTEQIEYSIDKSQYPPRVVLDDIGVFPGGVSVDWDTESDPNAQVDRVPPVTKKYHWDTGYLHTYSYEDGYWESTHETTDFSIFRRDDEVQRVNNAGETEWQFGSETEVTRTHFDDNSVIVETEENFHRLQPESGEIMWSKPKPVYFRTTDDSAPVDYYADYVPYSSSSNTPQAADISGSSMFFIKENDTLVQFDSKTGKHQYEILVGPGVSIPTLLKGGEIREIGPGMLLIHRAENPRSLNEGANRVTVFERDTGRVAYTQDISHRIIQSGAYDNNRYYLNLKSRELGRSELVLFDASNRTINQRLMSSDPQNRFRLFAESHRAIALDNNHVLAFLGQNGNRNEDVYSGWLLNEDGQPQNKLWNDRSVKFADKKSGKLIIGNWWGVSEETKSTVMIVERSPTERTDSENETQTPVETERSIDQPQSQTTEKTISTEAETSTEAVRSTSAATGPGFGILIMIITILLLVLLLSIRLQK